jgi:hypothetical protein
VPEPIDGLEHAGNDHQAMLDAAFSPEIHERERREYREQPLTGKHQHEHPQDEQDAAERIPHEQQSPLHAARRWARIIGE